MGRRVFGLSRDGSWKTYQMPDAQRSEQGSEGKIHFLKGKSQNFCIKEFLSKEIAGQKFSKLEAMVETPLTQRPPAIKGEVKVIWPLELIFSIKSKSRTNFIGYKMDAAQADYGLDALILEKNEFSKSLNLHDRLKIAQFAALLFSSCHSKNFIIGDARLENILVDKGSKLPWKLEAIDADSFQFKDRNITYTSDMGDPAYASPRILRESGGISEASLKGLERKKSDDNFALAVMIFQILFKWHPFQNKRGIPIAENIRKSAFAFENALVKANINAPADEYKKLPKNLRGLFRRAFLKEENITGRTWALELEKAFKSLPKPKPSPTPKTPSKKPREKKKTASPTPSTKSSRPSPPPAPPPPPPVTPRKPDNGSWWLVPIAIIAFLFFKNLADGDEESTSTPVTEQPAPPVPASNPDILISERSYYLSHWANVRSQPTGGSLRVGKLNRNDPVSGVVVRGSRKRSTKWLKISSGSFKDRYVSVVNLVSAKLPELNTQTAGDHYLVQDVKAQALKIDSDAAQFFGLDQKKMTFPKASKVNVVGIYIEFPKYAEISHPSGGVAFIPLNALGEDDGDNKSRRVRIVNECSSSLMTTFSYRSNGSWNLEQKQDVLFWTFKPDSTSFVADLSSQDIFVDSSEIYYTVLANDMSDRLVSEPGSLLGVDKENVRLFGKNVKLKRAVPLLNSNDDYEITFCG